MTAIRQEAIQMLEKVPEDTNDKQLRQEKELPCMTMEDI